jgi:hypothetical protein
VNVASGIHPEASVENMEGENIAVGWLYHWVGFSVTCGYHSTSSSFGVEWWSDRTRTVGVVTTSTVRWSGLKSKWSCATCHSLSLSAAKLRGRPAWFRSSLFAFACSPPKYRANCGLLTATAKSPTCKSIDPARNEGTQGALSHTFHFIPASDNFVPLFVTSCFVNLLFGVVSFFLVTSLYFYSQSSVCMKLGQMLVSVWSCWSNKGM